MRGYPLERLGLDAPFRCRQDREERKMPTQVPEFGAREPDKSLQNRDLPPATNLRDYSTC